MKHNGLRAEGNNPVFVNYNGNVTPIAANSKLLANLRKVTNLKETTIMTFRHALATHISQNPDIAEHENIILGHSQKVANKHYIENTLQVFLFSK